MTVAYWFGYVLGFAAAAGVIAAVVLSPLGLFVIRPVRRAWELPLLRAVTGRKNAGRKADAARVAELESALDG